MSSSISVSAILRWTLSAFFTLFVAARAFPEEPRGTQHPALTLDDIAKAWKAKHDSVRSGHFTWTEERWLRKGYYSLPAPGHIRHKVVPPEDTIYTYESTFVFDGERMRYESERPEPHIRDRDIMPHHHVGVWDGIVGKVASEHQRLPTGQIHSFALDLSESKLFALRTAFRMLHPQWFSLDVSEYVLSERQDIVAGFPCVIMETSPTLLATKARRGRRPLKSSYWISPEQGFAVVRFTLTLHDKMLSDYHVRYKQTAEDKWYPAAWRFIEGSTTPPSEIIEATVTECALNVHVNQTAFDYAFPPGTWVRDMRSGENFLALDDGGKRAITDAERRRGATYEDLLDTEAGMAKLAIPVRRGPTWMWIAVPGVLLVVATIVLLIRLIRRAPLF